MGGAPPAVATVGALGVVLHQAGLRQLAQVVAGGPAVGAEPGRQRGGGGGAVEPQRAEQARPQRVGERLELCARRVEDAQLAVRRGHGLHTTFAKLFCKGVVRTG